jgi:hypothetical protein
MAAKTNCYYCGNWFIPTDPQNSVCPACREKNEAIKSVPPPQPQSTTPPAVIREWSNSAAESPAVASSNVAMSPTFVDRAEKDAKRLYAVADGIYGALIAFNWIIGILGVISALGLIFSAININSGGPLIIAIVVLAVTSFVCLMNYAVAVLATHFAKVLSNISLAQICGNG